MKILLLGLSFLFSSSGIAADKATFSIFGAGSKFAEITCQGITGYPGAFTFRLPASPDSPENFEAYVDMIPPFKLVVTASTAAGGRTLYLGFAREDASPTFASTKGADLALRIGSGLDVYCELNQGTQITKDL